MGLALAILLTGGNVIAGDTMPEGFPAPTPSHAVPRQSNAPTHASGNVGTLETQPAPVRIVTPQSTSGTTSSPYVAYPSTRVYPASPPPGYVSPGTTYVPPTTYAPNGGYGVPQPASAYPIYYPPAQYPSNTPYVSPTQPGTTRPSTPPQLHASSANSSALRTLLRFTPDADMFPAVWRRGRTRARASALRTQHERSFAQGVATRALAKYPMSMLRRYVDRVYILGRLHFYGVQAGGTNSNRRIYVCYGGFGADPTGRSMERVLHAELSSVLLRSNPHLLSRAQWSRVNPPRFRYGASGSSALRRGKGGVTPRPSYMNRGFLYQYAQSSFENDFNSIASYLFLDGGPLWAYTQRWKKIGYKARLAVRFYAGLHPRFTEAWFRRR